MLLKKHRAKNNERDCKAIVGTPAMAKVRRMRISQSVSNGTSLGSTHRRDMETHKMKRSSKYLLLCTTIAICFASVGCESFTSGSAASKKKKKDSQSWFSFKKKEYQIPQSMNVTWTSDILTLAGKPPTRGFGGRFYFYNEKTQAIPVDGDLVVYGFDDTFKVKGTEDLNLADKRFRFTAEQFTTHFTEGDLGASYSVWIPWDEAYGPQKKIMLIPTFLTKEGRLIRGSAANLNLPGKEHNPNEGVIQQTSAVIPTALPGQIIDMRKQAANVRPGSFVPGADGISNGIHSTNSNNGMRTTTIQVDPNSLMRRNGSPVQQASSLDADQANAVSNAYAQLPMNGASPNLLALAEQPGTLSYPQQLPANSIPATAATTAATTSTNTVQNKGFFTPPTSMPLNQTAIKINNSSGWALPEYPPMTWQGLSPHSAPNQLQAPASPNAQPGASRIQ
jgi:hypothetical protein